MSNSRTIDLSAAIPLLDDLPFPALWIRHDYSVRWANRAARCTYGKSSELCFELTHGREQPCPQFGFPCPKDVAEVSGNTADAIHAHTGQENVGFFWVMAVPLEDDAGVLELHMNLGQSFCRDGLTGLYRREFWTEVAQRGQELLARLERPYVVLFLDLDRFKTVNDRLGHHAGDELLTAIGSTLESSIRTSDTVGRYGGEEFVVFMPNTTAHDALPVAERIREAIADLEVATPAGPARVTASIGLRAASSGESVEQALEIADQMMYRCKSAGGNRIVASP